MKRLFSSFIVILLAIGCLLVVNALYNRTDQSSGAYSGGNVLLLTEDETGSFYMRLKQGMEDEAGAAKVKMTTFILGTSSETQVAEPLNSRYQAAVVYIKNPALLEQTLETLKKEEIPSITIENGQGDYAVMRDSAADAQKLVNSVKQTGYHNILVLTGDEGPAKKDFLQLWSDQVTYLRSPAEANRYPSGCIVSFSQECALALLKARTNGSLSRDIPFFCCDTGENRVADIESGAIQGMLVPRPYKIGCLAMETCRALMAHAETTAVTLCPSYMITLGNLYDSENVDVMFPLLL